MCPCVLEALRLASVGLYLAWSKNIARIAKRCPENITSVVKCVKLLLPKVLSKYLKKKKNTVVTAVTEVTIVRKITQPLKESIFYFLSTFEKCNLTHLTTDVMFSVSILQFLQCFLLHYCHYCHYCHNCHICHYCHYCHYCHNCHNCQNCHYCHYCRQG